MILKTIRGRFNNGYFCICICDNCTIEFKRKRNNAIRTKNHFCSPKCYFKYNTGEKHFRWKEGNKSDGGGYRKDMKKNHPSANKYGYIATHRLVMEEAIGRNLNSEEIVHHIDGDTSNNKLSNLMLFKNNAEHLLFHKKIKKEKLFPYFDYMGNKLYDNLKGNNFGFKH